MKLKAILSVFVFLIVGFLILSPGCKEPPSKSSLPKVSIVDLNGKSVQLSDFAGKPVLINFWATWCGPCRIEIPMLNDLHQKYGDKGLVILGISTDEDGVELVKEFTKEVPIEYGNYLKTDGLEQQFGGVWALPTSYIYDRTGKQVDKIVGLQTRDYFEKKIQQVLKD